MDHQFLLLRLPQLPVGRLPRVSASTSPERFPHMPPFFTEETTKNDPVSKSADIFGRRIFVGSRCSLLTVINSEKIYDIFNGNIFKRQVWKVEARRSNK